MSHTYTKRIKQLTVIVFILGICISCTACSKNEKESHKKSEQPVTSSSIKADQEVLQSIKERGEIRVGIQVGYPPFEMLDYSGNLIGFDIDSAQIIASELGVELRLVRLNWAELFPMLLDGKIDIIMSGMTITTERNLQVLFTNPVVETGRMFLVHTTNIDKFKAFRDLNLGGIFVAITPGSAGSLRLAQILPKAAIREFPDMKTAVNEIIEKRAQAFVDEEFAIRNLCATKPNTLNSRYEHLTYETIGWAVKPKEFHFLNLLNNYIIKMQGDGRLDALKKKWMHDYFNEIRSLSLK